MNIKNEFYVRLPYFNIYDYKKICNLNCDEIIEFGKNHFLEGLLIESYDLYKSIKEEKESRDIISHSINKYLLRSATRTTPHGLSVKIMKGSFKDNPKKTFDEINNYRTIELDFEWCQGVLKIVENNNFEKLNITLNNHIEINKDTIFNEWIDCTCERKEEKINIVIDKKAPLEKIISLLDNGPIKIKEVKDCLLEEYEGVSEQKIDNFLKELLDNQIICSDLRINMLSTRTITWLIEIISSYDNTSSIVDKLKEINNEIKKYQNDLINQGNDKLEYIMKLMESIWSCKNYLCITLYNKEELFLDEAIKDDLKDYVNFLNVVALGKNKTDSYYHKFIDKYGFQAVNIKDVVDSVNGIGLPKSNDVKENKYYQKIKSFIFENNNDEVDLSQLFNKLPLVDNEFDDFELAFRIYEKNKRNFYEVTPVTGSNQMYKIMGRFKEIEQKHFSKSNHDKVEIIYYPKIERVGNVLSCSTVAEYVLDYGNTNIVDKHKIKINDIYVFPFKGKLILVNKNNGRKLKFINTNMTTFNFMPDILKTLINLSNRYEPDPFSLNHILQDIFKGVTFKKKVVYKNFIISPKTLEICKKEMPNKDITKYIFSRFQKSILFCGIRDNLLLLDLNVESHKDILKKMFNQYETLLIQDTDMYDCLNVKNEQNGNFINEYIFELYNTNTVYEVLPNIQYIEYPDSYENSNDIWLSFKLYMYTAYMNKFIINQLNKFVETHKQIQLIKKFFYIRYIDDAPHLRVRFLVNKKMVGKLFEVCYEYFNYQKSLGYIKKIIVDEYNPELVRYGGKSNIVYVENIFELSSEYSISEIEYGESKIRLYENYILFVYYISVKINYEFEMILNEFEKYTTYYHRNDLTDSVRRKIIMFENGKSSINSLFTNKELIIIQKIIDELNIMIKNRTINYVGLSTMLTSLFHMHFNRLIGINRLVENQLNGNIENIMYTIEKMKLL